VLTLRHAMPYKIKAKDGHAGIQVKSL